MKRPTGIKHDKAFADKWFARVNADLKAKEGITYRNVFLDDVKMKKKSKIKKILNRKTDKTPTNVSTMQGDDKPETDTSNLIQIGAQVGMPEEKKKKKSKTIKGMDLLKKRISFADFRKQSQELNYGRDRI